MNAFQSAIQRHLPRIRFVAEKVGKKTVGGLEKTATALYVTLRDPGHADRVQRLISLKPHIALPDAQEAVIEVEQIIREAQAHYVST
jgi:hypothetical protein